jgi:uncharacterized cupredoxin-like copper-binding protein
MSLSRIIHGSLLLAAITSAVGATGATAPGAIQETADTTISIRAAGTALEFTPKRLALKEGSRVRIRFVNDGSLPHNLVVPRDRKDLAKLTMAAMSAGETGYVPMDWKDKLIGWTTLAAPGQSVEVVIEVPKAGEFTYVCLFPGHAATMTGIVRVVE